MRKASVPVSVAGPGGKTGKKQPVLSVVYDTFRPSGSSKDEGPPREDIIGQDRESRTKSYM